MRERERERERERKKNKVGVSQRCPCFWILDVDYGLSFFITLEMNR